MSISISRSPFLAQLTHRLALLAGVAVLNGVVMVTFVNQLRQEIFEARGDWMMQVQCR